MISADNPWEGSFSIDETIGTNTTIVLMSPLIGSFAISMTSPNGEIIYLENEVGDTNWDSPNSEIGVTWLKLTDNVNSTNIFLNELLILKQISGPAGCWDVELHYYL